MWSSGTTACLVPVILLPRFMRRHTTLAIVGSLSVLLGAAASLQGSPRFRPVPSRPDTTVTSDPIARLQARIDAGEVVLAYDSTLGYLPAVLRALDIPVSSQGLVFSRTSLQTDKISPWSPRALFFNDDVYVGYVRDGLILEIAAVDRNVGAVFYTLSQERGAKPTFAREGGTCLMCHQSRATGGVPGFMMRSTIADRNGYPITGAHEGTTTDDTPIRQRWGGWYVTGTHGTAGHSGNVFSPLLSHEVSDKSGYRRQIDLTTESARTDLAGKFDATTYLSAHSDIVALMVLVHQTTVHNLIAAVHDAAGDALSTSAYGASTAPTAGGTVAAAPELTVRLRTAIEELVRAMLFAKEAKLEGPVRGTTSFATEFSALGPRDAKGRSLRDLDLERRLFRYPLSFLVYSESFDAIPDVAKQEVYRRLRTVLSGDDTSAAFATLQAADRTAILEILEATKPDFVKARAK